MKEIETPPNKRLERTGEQPNCFMRTPVVAGRSTAGRWAAGDGTLLMTLLRALTAVVPLAASLLLPSLAAAERTPFSVSESGKLKSGRPFSVKIAESPYIQSQNEPSDDGSRWGIDGSFPNTFVTTFAVELGGTPVFIPRKLYRDLSYVHRVEVSEEEGHLVIDIQGGDAAGSYRARFLFRDFEIERMVRGGEFPTSVWERTVYHNSLSVDVE